MVKDNSSKIEKRKDIRNERIKILLLYPFKNNWIITTISLGIFIIYFMRAPLSPFYLTIYAFAWWMLYPFISDLLFYGSYFVAYDDVRNLLFLSKNEGEKYDLSLEKFQKNYNKLRKRLKRLILAPSGNLLTYDYEISRIVRNIDTFFDATIKILYKRKVMPIPFSPHDEYYKFMEEVEIQSRLDDEKWQNIEPPPSEYDFEAWEIKVVNFETISAFLRYFGDVVIRKPRTKGLNTIAIGELFRKWNLIIQKIDPSIFNESKKDVENYYDERRERRGFLISKLFELIALIGITLILAVITGILGFEF